MADGEELTGGEEAQLMNDIGTEKVVLDWKNNLISERKTGKKVEKQSIT